jgi:YkoP domain
MRGLIRFLDRLLCRCTGVYEFSDDPKCILRVQYTQATHNMPIGREMVLKGEPVLALHMWNERTPIIPAGGADLGWALNFRRLLVHSLRGVAKEMMNDRQLAQVRAVCGISALFSSSDHIGGTRMMERLGFIVIPYHQPLGRFGEFWENLFSWWLMWAYNDASLHRRKLSRLQRTEIWMLANEFFERYGDANATNQPQH